MSSNSKLNSLQKQERKQLKADFLKAGGVIVHVEGVTVALMRTGENTGLFSVSVASVDEQKDRRKVGEFYALDRWNWGTELPCRLRTTDEAMIMGFRDVDYLTARAEEIAEVIAVG